MTNSRSEALQYALDHLNADTFGADEIATFHEMATAAFTEPAAAMPGVPEREAIISLVKAIVQRHGMQAAVRTGEIAMEVAEAFAKLSPSHSGETGEVERLREALIQADLKIRSYPGADQSDVAFIRAALGETPNDGGRDDASNEQRGEG